MQSRKISAHKGLSACPRRRAEAGFSLIEILVVTAIITVLAGIGLIVGLDSYRGYSYRSERNVAVHVLQKARSRAMNNMFETAHGIHFGSSEYVLFRGNAYNPSASTNESIPKNPAVTITGPADIVFRQLSGDSNFTGDITITDGVRTNIISTNGEGRINW